MNGVLMSAVKELGIKVEDLFKNKTAAAPAPEAAAATATAAAAGDVTDVPFVSIPNAAGAAGKAGGLFSKIRNSKWFYKVEDLFKKKAPDAPAQELPQLPLVSLPEMLALARERLSLRARRNVPLRFNPRTTTNRHLFNVRKELFTLRTMLETRGVFGLGIGQFQFKNIMKDMKFPGFDFDMDGLKNVGERFKPLVRTGRDFLDSLQVAVGAGLKSALGAGNSLYQTGKSMAD